MLSLTSYLYTSASLSQLASLDLSEFLAGPGRDDTSICVDDVFAGTLGQALDALSHDYKIPLDLAAPVAEHHWPLLATLGAASFRAPLDDYGYPVGVVVADAEGRIVGSYAGCSLAVHPEHRGQGLGRALVALRFLLDGSLPLWDHDEAGYSFAGHAAHVSGHALLIDMTAAPTL